MTILDIAYYIAIVANFIVSIVQKRLWRHFYFLYFFITIAVEIFAVYYHHWQRVYNFLDIFSILFFCLLFIKEIVYKKFLMAITGIALILAVYYIYICNTSYSIYTGLVFCIYSIFISLNWFYNKIAFQKDTESILERSLFWISCSLLFWSVFYLFRMMPMYWIQNEDENFLYTLKYIFQVATVISYILFFKGLLSKKV
ncbi:hypothetical protein J2T04_000154 [Chryseobacterium lathyri]|uniref:Uncharacterized protein n=1 Tax=Chryseobacterium lathyri TaxID=395933 RepID=A0ABT9SH19_9FLAO|nr:hypothetical protein [Chryseobacterium lathyri]